MQIDIKQQMNEILEAESKAIAAIPATDPPLIQSSYL